MKNYIFAVILLIVFPALLPAQVDRNVAQDTVIVPGETIIVNGDEVQDIGVDNNIDSLLSLWYMQHALQDTSDFLKPLDIPVLELPDEVYISRLKALPCIINLPYNHLVRNQIIYYTQRIPEKTEMILGLSDFYFPQIEEILDQYDMPVELRAMAVIESALNPRAVSRARAKGMWQFMYGTAKLYGLTMNSYVDERFDPIASTHAAARHMRDLYNIFGDWGLAIAAYNCGAGNVNKAIRRSGGKRDFWDVYPYLPRETRGYVPAFIAANYVLAYYKEHHLTPKKIYMPSHIDTFVVNKMLHLEQVSEVVGIPIDELRNFNPQYMHDIVPGAERPYVLRVPYEYTALFADREKEIYTYKDSIYFNPNIIKQVASRGYQPQGIDGRNKIIHRVKEGETLGGLAVKYKVYTNDIRYWNGIRGNIIRTGQKLVIYTKMKQAAPVKVVASATKPNQGQKGANGGSAITHVVREGETLWSISQLYDDITWYDLMQLNSMTKKSKIFPGDKIKIKTL
ncbi:MAG: transglycosylase SLT domain-containing protein [Prevotellaceae bacterium]|jgi:membrane-bound lytic murein transglycosylase D|nr:transglycosylase SLT domain-containing protein [Prevotellaceae bacterium]